MSLFGLKEKKELEIAREVISRDRRVQRQYEDARKVKYLEKVVAALIATAILWVIIRYL